MQDAFFLETVRTASQSEIFERTLAVDPHLAAAAVQDRDHTALNFLEATKHYKGRVASRYAASSMEGGYDPSRPLVSYIPIVDPLDYSAILSYVACGSEEPYEFGPGKGGSVGTAFDFYNHTLPGTAYAFAVDVSMRDPAQDVTVYLHDFTDYTELYAGHPTTVPADADVSHYDIGTDLTPIRTYYQWDHADITGDLLTFVVFHKGTLPFIYFNITLSCHL